MARQPGAQQGQRVAAQAQACGGVVEHDFFALLGLRQFKPGLMNRRLGKDGRQAGLRCGLPHLLASVACQTAQRIGGGQRFHVGLVQLRS